MVEAARSRGKVLRHIGKVTASGEASVGVAELDAEASLANTALTDNIVRYSTRRYSTNPLIVQGPGAGPEVTAGGVFADLLRLASELVVDTVVQPGELRREVVARLALAEGKPRHFSERRHGIPPV